MGTAPHMTVVQTMKHWTKKACAEIFHAMSMCLNVLLSLLYFYYQVMQFKCNSWVMLENRNIEYVINVKLENWNYAWVIDANLGSRKFEWVIDAKLENWRVECVITAMFEIRNSVELLLLDFYYWGETHYMTCLKQ